MAKKRRRSVAEITCPTKTGYETRGEAESIRRQMQNFDDWNGRNRRPLEVYQCRVCGLFHLGNADEERVRAGRDRMARQKRIEYDEESA
jgi:hypothetical protein